MPRVPWLFGQGCVADRGDGKKTMARTLASTYAARVDLVWPSDSPATVTSTGVLQGGLAGSVYESGWSVWNAGTIAGTGLYLNGPASVYNVGAISGTVYGVRLLGGSAVNAGSVSGGTYGFDLTGGSFTNLSTGTISGLNGANVRAGSATVVNAGAINANPAANGIVLQTGNLLINQTGGSIFGFNGVRVNGAATVVSPH